MLIFNWARSHGRHKIETIFAATKTFFLATRALMSEQFRAWRPQSVRKGYSLLTIHPKEMEKFLEHHRKNSQRLSKLSRERAQKNMVESIQYKQSLARKMLGVLIEIHTRTIMLIWYPQLTKLMAVHPRKATGMVPVKSLATLLQEPLNSQNSANKSNNKSKKPTSLSFRWPVSCSKISSFQTHSITKLRSRIWSVTTKHIRLPKLPKDSTRTEIIKDNWIMIRCSVAKVERFKWH